MIARYTVIDTVGILLVRSKLFFGDIDSNKIRFLVEANVTVGRWASMVIKEDYQVVTMKFGFFSCVVSCKSLFNG